MDKTWISRKRNTPEFRQGVDDFIRFAVAYQKDGETLCYPCKSCGNMGKVSTIDEINMDKTWTTRKCNTPEFRHGVEDFIRFEVAHQKDGENPCCPCKSCGNMGKVSTTDELRNHIFWNGFSKNYKEWIWHGEGLMSATNNDCEDPVHDSPNNESRENYQLDEMCSMEEGERSDAFDSLISDAEKPLYSGCTKYTRLSGVLKLFKLKAENGWSDKSFTELLKALKDMLPEGNELPSSTYQAKKMLCPMGLDAEKIHACPNDCVLYRKEYKDLRECPKCKASRY